MSADYCVYACDVTLSAARAALLALPELQIFEGNHARLDGDIQITLRAPQAILWLHEIRAVERRASLRELYDIDPDVGVFLTADKFAEPLRCRHAIASIVRALLEAASGDAIFYFTQGDGLLLQRRGSKVTVDDTAGNFWLHDPVVLEEFGMPYSLGTLPRI